MWKQIGKLFALLLCSVICIGMSTNVASAQNWVEVGQYSIGTKYRNGIYDTTHKILIDTDSIESHADENYTYYFAAATWLEITDDSHYKAVRDYKFRHDNKTGEWRCIEGGDYDIIDAEGEHRAVGVVFPIEDEDFDGGLYGWYRAGDPDGPQGVYFLTSPNSTPGYIARHEGTVVNQFQLEQGNAAYLLRAILAHQNGQAITRIDEGRLTVDNVSVF